MAYGVLYEFHRTSTNGADMLITISQKGYNGAVKKRALGRAPVIKRDNNGHIYGTSCELYAECLVDGEFSHLYTSDAYEYKVEVYKNNTLLWAGFVSPELYSEPDIAPPYDVQIIATDGLGELKNYNFNKRGVASILDHIKALMSNTGIDLGFNVVSGLRYIDENGAASAIKDILNVKLDLDHEEGNTCYDVLQGILSSLNANITQHNGSYLMFRETDFISKAGANGVEAFTAAGNNINLGVASFGTMKANQWWPVGQLSTVIEPAKNQIVLKSPNHYKGNVLRFDNWTTSEMASFSEAENAYILPGANSYITQTVDFGGHQVGYRLGLRVRARNVGTATEEEQNIGLKVEMEGQTSTVGPNYWLVKPATGGRRPTSGYMWRNTESSFEEDLTTPSEAEDASDAQDIDIVLPLYREGLRAFAYAKRIKLTIFNPKGLYNIHVYDVSLVKYEQIKGYEANVTIDNMARESESDVNLTITAGDLAPAAGNVFMTGLPLRPTDSEVITKWQIENNASQDYLAAMAFDYSRGISLPRMKYSGILNVPGSATVLPTLFLRDGTYYFPHTYSYDLYSDEITVELISISAADVSLSSVAISQSAEAVGTMGATTGGTSGGGGAVSIPRDKQMSDTSDNAVENKVIKAYVDQAKKDVEDLLASMWQLIGDRVVTDKKTVVENDLIVEGDVATGGSGGGTAAAGTVTGVLVGSDRYEDVTAGLLDLTEAFNKIDVSEQLKDYLPLIGGTLTGNLSVQKTSGDSTIYLGTGGAVLYGETEKETALYNSGDGYPAIKVKAGTAHPIFRYNYKDNIVLHSGNIGSYAIGKDANGKVTSNVDLQNASIRFYKADSSLRGILGAVGDDTTNNLYWYNNSAWKTIAFTDSTVAAANQLVTSAGDATVTTSTEQTTIYGNLWVWAQGDTDRQIKLRNNRSDLFTTLKADGSAEIFVSAPYSLKLGTANTTRLVVNSSGNVTIGESDLAGTDAKLYVHGKVAAGALNVSSILTSTNNSGFDIVAHGGAATARIFLTKGTLRPWTEDNGLIDLGLSNIRWRTLYAVGANLSGAATIGGTLSVSGKTTISNDLVVSGDVSTGGDGTGTGAAGTVTAIAVNGQTYEPTAGIVTIPDYPTSLTWSAINDRPTHLSDFTDDVVAGKYLPLIGGTLTGNLSVQKTSGDSTIYLGTGGAVLYGETEKETALYNSGDGYPAIKVKAGTAHPIFRYNYKDNIVLHSGNIGSYAIGKDANGKVTSNVDLQNASIRFYKADSSLRGILGAVGDDTTNNLYWYNNSAWKTIAFTDSTVAAANQLVTSAGDATVTTSTEQTTIYGNLWVWAQGDTDRQIKLRNNRSDLFTTLKADGSAEIFVSAPYSLKLGTANTTRLVVNSSGNVTIGESDLAGTDAKLYVHGKVAAGALNVSSILTSTNNSGFDIVAHGGAATARIFLTKGTLRPWTEDNGLIDLGLSNIRWRTLYAVGANLSGAATIGGTLSVTGKTTISNDLVVSGDVSTGGNGGGSSSGGSGDSLCLGPVELDMQSITSLGTFTQAQMDGFGLTTAVISNMLAGLYTKVIGLGGGDVYDYNGFGTIGSIIRLFLRQGNGESVDYTYTLYYDGSKWTITEN